MLFTRCVYVNRKFVANTIFFQVSCLSKEKKYERAYIYIQRNSTL